MYYIIILKPLPEISLGCNDFMAEEREREQHGYINRALPVDELDEFANDLAQRITSFPRSAIQATKQAVDYGDGKSYDAWRPNSSL